jgi:hypothetical protein
VFDYLAPLDAMPLLQLDSPAVISATAAIHVANAAGRTRGEQVTPKLTGRDEIAKLLTTHEKTQ